MIPKKELSDIASRLFRDSTTKYRLMQKYRPYICPYDELIELVPNRSTILDIGCGGGLFLGLLSATNRITLGHGFDSSEPAIDTAKKMANQVSSSNKGIKLKFEARSAKSSWPEGEYDVVSLIDVVHHIPPSAQEGVIFNAIQRMKPGGIFIYKDMCKKPLWRANANRMHDLILAKEWIHYLEISKVIELGKSHNLEVKKTSTINQLWYGHELVVFKQ